MDGFISFIIITFVVLILLGAVFVVNSVFSWAISLFSLPGQAERIEQELKEIKELLEELEQDKKDEGD